jgi:gliding motility-associated-like protein
MGTVNYATLSAWQTATTKDANSITIDPVFNDISIGDLTPTKIPFEDKGAYVGITSDIWNVTRSTTTPDIGAFEFSICKTLTAPVLTADSAGVNTVRFRWTPVANTSGYRISLDSGATWKIPSSGAFGLTHTITGIKASDSVQLIVKALGSRVDCPDYISNKVTAKTLADGIFIPNTFTPNNNGQNDVFRVYTNVLRSVHWMVFNQWGEKVFETADLEGTWDGTYKGKPQPIGVYVYVVVGTYPNGNKVTQKGTFNLIR